MYEEGLDRPRIRVILQDERLVLLKLSWSWQTREKLKKKKCTQIEWNERAMTSKFNKVPRIKSWQGRKKRHFWIQKFEWECVNYLVVLYWCGFSNLDGCYVRVFVLLTFKQHLGVMKHYVCILPSEGFFRGFKSCL